MHLDQRNNYSNKFLCMKNIFIHTIIDSKSFFLFFLFSVNKEKIYIFYDYLSVKTCFF